MNITFNIHKHLLHFIKTIYSYFANSSCTNLSIYFFIPDFLKRNYVHCVKSVQIWSYFWSVLSCIQTKYRKYGPEITPYLDTFYAVVVHRTRSISSAKFPYICIIIKWLSLDWPVVWLIDDISLFFSVRKKSYPGYHLYLTS